jgi:type IV pilus assembly protein PilX
MIKQIQNRQQGFVLVLTLVLLAVLTLIGVSSMNSSSMELRASANARQHQIAFNVVQSLLEFSVSADGAALIDFQINDPKVTQSIKTYTVKNGSALQSDAVFSGCGVALGNSLEEGKGFSFNYFDITGSGSNAKGTANSVQVQGIRFPAASC